MRPLSISYSFMPDTLGQIPFCLSLPIGKEQQYMAEALESGRLSGDGAFTKRCHTLLEATLGAPKALLTTSCTHALEMAAFLMNIGPGDEVIVPSFTFVSTPNAFAIRGATPKFIDIRPDTLNLDERLLERAITPKTKAIVPVHYAGVGCDMEAIQRIASAKGIPIIEDNAHGLMGTYRGRMLGSFGTLSTLSFHETKNFSSGEGGALIINDPSLFDRAEIIREKGTNRSRFFRGQIDKYSWVDFGSSYLPSELNAAILLAQLEQRTSIQAHRKSIWTRYHEALTDWANHLGAELPTIPADRESAFHLFHILMPDLGTRQAFIESLRGKKVAAVFHYLPLHLTEMGRRFGGRKGDCPVTENVSDRLVRLPLYNALSSSQVERVIETVLEFKPR